MNQKYRPKRIALIALSFLIISGCTNKKNNIHIDKEIILETELGQDGSDEKEYDVNDLYVMVCNDGSGHAKYYFVEKGNEMNELFNESRLTIQNYKSINTSKTFLEKIYSYDSKGLYTYNTIPEITLKTIFNYSITDYRYATAKIKACDFPIPEEFRKKIYTKEELEKIESFVNHKDYDIYEERKNIFYAIDALFAFRMSNQTFLFSRDHSTIVKENRNPKDFKTLKNVFFMPSLTHPNHGVKIESGRTIMEDSIYLENGEALYNLNSLKLVSNDFYFMVDLYKNFNGDSYFLPDVKSYLTPEQLNNGVLTYDEITELENKLSKQFLEEDTEQILNR